MGDGFERPRHQVQIDRHKASPFKWSIECSEFEQEMICTEVKSFV